MAHIEPCVKLRREGGRKENGRKLPLTWNIPNNNEGEEKNSVGKRKIKKKEKGRKKREKERKWEKQTRGKGGKWGGSFPTLKPFGECESRSNQIEKGRKKLDRKEERRRKGEREFPGVSTVKTRQSEN